MNTSVTSREAILEACRRLVSEKGLSSLNMRNVAKACGVSLGSLYYYFPAKKDLMIAVIESVWADIFHRQDAALSSLSFAEYIESYFLHIQAGIRKYPNFFTLHSISVSSDGQAEARSTMTRYLSHCKEKLSAALAADPGIREDAFSDSFRPVDFVDFVLSDMIYLLIRKQGDCAVLLEIIRRTIY